MITFYGSPMSSAGLDEPAYRQVASMWGQRLATDASLHAKYAAMMQESQETAQL